MDRTEITFKVPANIVEQAQNAGLLTDEARVGKLFEIMDQLAALEPRLTLEEIEAEIEAARNETR